MHSQAKNQQFCHDFNSFLTEVEVETDEDHATKRKSFSLAQNILFVNYPNIFPVGAWTMAVMPIYILLDG